MDRTYFFSDINGCGRSKEELQNRFENARHDLENFLRSTQKNTFEKCLELVKIMAVAFLPDKIGCCVKKKGDILAANVIGGVYKRLDDALLKNKPDNADITIENALMTGELTIEESDPARGKKFSYTREIKDFCWYGFENLATFFRFKFKGRDVSIEFLLPYKLEKAQREEIRRVINDKIISREIIKDKLFEEIGEAEPEPLYYFKPGEDLIKTGNISIEEHRYTERTVEKIEESLEQIFVKSFNIGSQVWIVQHFQNDGESCPPPGDFNRIKDHVKKSFGFYTHFTRKGRKDHFWKWFKEEYKKGYIFKELKKKLWELFPGNGQDYGAKKFAEEFGRQLENILEKESKDVQKDEAGIIDKEKTNEEFEKGFEALIKKQFDKHWDCRTDSFFQASDIGAVSSTRFTRLPEFLIEIASENEDPRNTYYYKALKEYEDVHRTQIKTERFLFADPIFSNYTTIPIVINRVYWGIIMIIAGELGGDDGIENGRLKYELHREILSRLGEIIAVAESGIIAEFESFAGEKLLKITNPKEFAENIKRIKKESKKNPLIPDIHLLDLKEDFAETCRKLRSQCTLNHKETGKIAEDKENCPALTDICKHYLKQDKLFFDRSYLYTIFPAGEKRRSCVAFVGERANKDYSPTIYLTTMRLAYFMEVGWRHALTQEEKASLNIKNASAAIIMDTFSHNIAAHCLNALGLYFYKIRRRINALGNSRLTIQPLEAGDGLSEKFNLLTDDFELEKIKRSAPGNAYEKISSLYDYMANKNRVIENFLKFMRSKSAFWSGAIGEQPPTAAIMDVNELLIQFVDNSLFLGSIGASEGIFGVRFFLDNRLVAVSHLEGGTFRYHYDNKIGDEKFESGLEERMIQWEKAALGPKPGKFFKDNINRQFFFPNGVIGVQALYTIWENILRNVKHTVFDGGIKNRNADSESSKLLPLKVEIRDEKNRDGEESSKYLITSYIDVEPGNVLKDQTGGEHAHEPAKKSPAGAIVSSIKKGIVDQSGKPVMGGTTQVVLCAGFLQGLSPAETHEKITDRKGSYRKLLDVVQDEGGGPLKYTVKVWKGEYYTKWQVVKGKINDPLKENIYRFRLIVMENPGEEKDMEDMIRPPIRRLAVEDLEALEKRCPVKGDKPGRSRPDKKAVFEELYRRWLDRWIFEEEIFVSCSVIMKWSRKSGIKEEKTEDPEWWQNKLAGEDKYKLYAFFHPSGPEYRKQNDLDIEERHIGFRNHGIFAQLTKKEGGTLLSRNLPELFEVLATRIVIIDDTIYKRFKNLHPKQKDILAGVLNLKIHPETRDRQKLSGIIRGDNQEKHFLVIHLSNVETVKEHNREVYKTDLQDFVREVIGAGKDKKGMYRFLVFTSGRNREIDKRNFDDYQKTHSLFIHREEFMQVMEWAEETPIEAAFLVKYGFVKKLIGT